MARLLWLVAFLVMSPAGTTPAVDQVSRERMRADVEFLCSPPLGGRASLSDGADAAAWFIASEMRKIGLRPAAPSGFLQRFDVVPVRLDRERSSITVVRDGAGQSFPAGAVFFPDPLHPIDLTADVVFAGFGITAPDLGYDDYAGIDVRGKAVLVFDHEPQEGDPRSVFNGSGFTLHANAWTKTINAQRHGAAALLVVGEPLNPHRAAPRAPGRANAPPQALVAGEVRIPRFTIPPDLAATLLKTTGRSPAEWQAQIERGTAPASRTLDGTSVRLRAVNAEITPAASWNVAGLVPGIHPKLGDETILVSAHYDGLGTQDGRLYAGANDNASGVAAMLEVARLLAARPLPRSVLFVAFGSEEQLMLGSYYYVAHPLRPLSKTVAVLNLDMVGRNEEHTPESEGAYELTAAGSDQLNLVGATFSPGLTEVLEQQGTRAGFGLSKKFDRDSSARALFRCDHLPFLQKGIPAVWLFGGFHPGYHEPADTIDRLDFEKMARVVRLTTGSVRALADRGEPQAGEFNLP